MIAVDVWDGDDDEPIIYHGYTLTSKIRLRDVLETIYDNAFKTSKYPVILSIENHLSVEQQKTMAVYFEGLLGDYLLTEPLPDHEDQWPSPEELAYKIIIKGKKLSQAKDDSPVPPTPACELQDMPSYGFFRSPSAPASANSKVLGKFSCNRGWNPRDFSDVGGEKDDDEIDGDQVVNLFTEDDEFVVHTDGPSPLFAPSPKSPLQATSSVSWGQTKTSSVKVRRILWDSQNESDILCNDNRALRAKDPNWLKNCLI